MKKILSLIVFLTVIGTADALAQCPMCRTAVESGMDDPNSKGRGLNDGILYLLATPYLAVAAVGFIWYKKNRSK